MSCSRTVSGVSSFAPDAFFKGANASARSTSDNDRLSGLRHEIENEPLELDRVRLGRLDPPAGGVDPGHLLPGDVERQAVSRRRHAPQTARRSMTWTAMLPAQCRNEPSALRCRATSSGRSLYSITISRPSICTTIPSGSSGSRLATTWLETRSRQGRDSR